MKEGNKESSKKIVPIGKSILRKFALYPEFGALVAFLVLFIVFSLSSNRFFSLLNLGGITNVVAEMGLVVVGITFLMISGEFDLSVGSNFALSAVVFGLLLNAGFPAAIAFLVSIALASVIGLINGLVTIKVGIPSFIVTLGAMMFWRGFVLGSSGGTAYVRYIGPNTPFIKMLNQAFSGQFRSSIFWLIAVVLIFAVVLNKTKYGNYVFATGGNPEASRSMGINVGRVKITNFVITGMLAGIAGCISFARFKAVDPYLGKDLALQAIAAAVIGGTTLYGGSGSIIGALIGTVIVSMIGSALVMMGVDAFWFQSVVGLILIAAVIINSRTRRLEKLI